MTKREREKILALIRDLALALPETSERLSHGAPTFFVRGKRSFLMVLTNHHGDGRFAIWCAAGEGLQKMLVDADPERFFVPRTSATAAGSGSGSTARSMPTSWPGSSRTPTRRSRPRSSSSRPAAAEILVPCLEGSPPS